MEKTVKGATKIKLAAPKSKYVESILLATKQGESGVAEVFRTLQLRLRDSTWTIVFKSLIIVHLMIREGQPEVTLAYLAANPKRLAISSFAEAQTQGHNIRKYNDYLMERVIGYRDVRTDFVKAGAGKMKRLTVDKGLLRLTEAVQMQIESLVQCDLLTSHDPDNEISLTAFRLLTLDLLELFKVMNEGTINVLEHYFEMSRPDAERALNIYRTFGVQTEQVVHYLSVARQYQTSTRLEVPKLKHAPTTLTASLEEYLNDPDFEMNRQQYMAQQQAKKSGKPVAPASSASKAAPAPVRPTTAPSAPQAQTQAKGPAPDLIDFFESIEQNQQQMAQNPPQQFQQAMPQGQVYQPMQMPQQTGYNPFIQPQPTFQSQPMPSQQLQPDFTGAGFGGYGPQPQQAPVHAFQFPTSLSPIPQNGVADFQSQSSTFSSSQPTQLQPQHTSTNPFRQSMLPTGNSQSPPVGASPNRSSTNPFAKHNTGQGFDANTFSPGSSVLYGQHTMSQSPVAELGQGGMFSPSPPALQPQRTGTNPFAKARPATASPTITTNVTGSTNPFRQSAFVNQQTGQGWQQGNQGTYAGFDLNNVNTTPIFPRPGHG